MENLVRSPLPSLFLCPHCPLYISYLPFNPSHSLSLPSPSPFHSLSLSLPLPLPFPPPPPIFTTISTVSFSECHHLVHCNLIFLSTAPQNAISQMKTNSSLNWYGGSCFSIVTYAFHTSQFTRTYTHTHIYTYVCTHPHICAHMHILKT